MTKQEFLEKWADHLCGMVGTAFAREQATLAGDEKAMAELGRFLKLQFRKAYKVAGEMFDDAQPQPKEKANATGSTQQNGQPQGARPGVAPARPA